MYTPNLVLIINTTFHRTINSEATDSIEEPQMFLDATRCSTRERDTAVPSFAQPLYLYSYIFQAWGSGSSTEEVATINHCIIRFHSITRSIPIDRLYACLLYTSDAADE